MTKLSLKVGKSYINRNGESRTIVSYFPETKTYKDSQGESYWYHGSKYLNGLPESDYDLIKEVGSSYDDPFVVVTKKVRVVKDGTYNGVDIKKLSDRLLQVNIPMKVMDSKDLVDLADFLYRLAHGLEDSEV